jgi:tetratricopeptide (TPR) repeat protein
VVTVAGSAPVAAQIPFVTEEPSPGPCAEARRAVAAEEFATARPLLQQCLQEDGRSEATLVALAMVCVHLEDAQAARGYGERAVALDPGDAEARYWYGRALLMEGETNAAETQWEEGLRRATTHVGLLEGLAKIALDNGQIEKAYGLLSQLRLQGVDAVWVHRLLADLARRKGLWKQSLLHWYDVLRCQEPGTQELLVALELSILAKQPRQAVAFGRRAVALEPQGETYSGLGQAYLAADQPDSAVVAFRRALELDAETPSYHSQLAKALESLGEYEEAERQYAAYVARRPDDAMGHLDYGLHFDRRGEKVLALEQISRAVDLDSELTAARIARAQVLESLGRYQEALADVDQLAAADTAQRREYTSWADRLRTETAAADGALRAGKVKLLHIVVADSSTARQVVDELAAGGDFAGVAARYSVGPTAVTGGDIGWVAPGDMVEPMRGAIEKLAPQETTPVVASRGYFHIFKRVR